MNGDSRAGQWGNTRYLGPFTSVVDLPKFPVAGLCGRLSPVLVLPSCLSSILRLDIFGLFLCATKRRRQLPTHCTRT